MEVKIIILKLFFFGATADIAGTRALDLERVEETSATNLIHVLSQKYPPLSNHKLLIAVNEEYADADTLLKDGDEIAIFTAVSGG